MAHSPKLIFFNGKKLSDNGVETDKFEKITFSTSVKKYKRYSDFFSTHICLSILIEVILP